MSLEQNDREGEAPAAPRPLHEKAFKLRFAAPRELGRSYVSAVKPLRLPEVVSGKFYRREPAGEVARRAEERARRRVSELLRAAPRDRHAAPVTTSHEYGWWWQIAAQLQGDCRRDPRLQHHIRDSAWLKERLRVLATDNGLRRH